ncbi:hypothetical protein K4F52_008972 [Lecanicillium sp. MT-2017a]|nr:hypothetical protein K4F52_008972 [Lecanicillium sp. MT-2017a]
MASAEHCLLCFEALDAELNNRKPLSLDEIQASWVVYNSSVASKEAFVPKDPALRRVAADSDSASTSSSSTSLAASTPATSAASLTPAVSSAPLFVTWNTVDDPKDAADDDNEEDDDDDDVSLRGCIGTFESQPLAEGIPEYAVISALQDTRFPPVSRRELPSLRVSVTLLTDFEEAADPWDWDIGVHGIRLSFFDRSRRYGSTYLPDIASEQGWTKDETLFSLVRKAGWMGSRSRWKDLELKVTRYQGKKVSMSYARYKKWKDWAASKAQ